MKTLFIIVLTFSFSFHLSAQWVEQESGTDNNLYRLYFLDNDNGWIIGEKIILKTVNGGQEWVDKSPSIAFDVYYKSLWFTDTNTGYIGCYFRSGTMQSANPYPVKTFNGGSTWEYETSVVLTYSQYGGINDVFFIDELKGWMVRSNVLYEASQGISGDFSLHSLFAERLYSVFFINQNVGWAAGNNGFITKTLDGGQTWNDLTTAITNDLKSVYFVNDNIGWAVGYIDDIGRIIKTTDGGETWYQVNHPSLIKLNRVQFVNDNIGWACGSKEENSEERGVILYTNDGGENWSEQFAFSEVSKINSLFFTDELTGWAVCSDGIVLKTTNAGGTSFEGVNEDSYFSHSLNVQPNPFTNSTTIQYELKQSEKVTLIIYDFLGKQVYQTNQYQQQGNQQLQWNADGYVDGVYYYRLQVGDAIANGKMVKVRR